ncbi:UNKNOWN [Stylonychia lemnae]|uniref:LITAF domain-containing protein n=1 Tax=Stylonychia lemnae TaxID=5949 RepID=A0A078B1G1_STYLE|nr:UNKNOWN [Stylonychia lemnae]|eukprot:CDW88369.1 UNKNOWN [Stylonychia lemnae]
MSSGAPHAPVFYVAHNAETAPCPNCRTSMMMKQRKADYFTWKMCCVLGGAAFMTDYFYKKVMKCLACGHTVNLKQ